jgi:hypothetical protein
MNNLPLKYHIYNQNNIKLDLKCSIEEIENKNIRKIRTKSNHILGPVSKEKVVELYQNGSIKPDDEVCSGNGYWFFIREDELVNRFLLGDEVQKFNPMSEAKNILITMGEVISVQDENDITLVEGINLKMLKAEESFTPIPPIPIESKSEVSEIKLQNTPSVPKKKSRSEIKPMIRKVAKPSEHQRWLKVVGLLGFLLLFLLVYFRKTILENFFHEEVTLFHIHLLPAAHAQEVTPEKKKSF